MARKLEHTDKGSMRSGRAIQKRPRERSQIVSGSLRLNQRSLRQKSRVESASQKSERTRKGELIQQ